MKENMKLDSVALDRIHIEDKFWTKYINLVKQVMIPYQWEAMNDRIPDAEPSHCLKNFEIAAGLYKGEFYGAVFQDTDIAKWLEAVGFTLSAVKDEELERTADQVIDLIARAQCEDGYINTYFTIKEPGKRWRSLAEGHELYTAGHLMEAASAYYYGTGKRKFLELVLKFADLICDTFGAVDGKIHGYPGHQEVEIGLIKLYQITKNMKYLDQARYFINARGVGENYFLKEMARPDYENIFPELKKYEPAYSQSHLPVRLQKTAEGHAVRAVYMYNAMAEIAYAYQDKILLETCENIWKNIVTKRMYITGSIGSSGILERFTADYDLPNDCNYSETCASIGLALFALKMNQITREASYMDVAERALYNTILAGTALDGKSFFYVNPLEVWPDNCMDRTSKEHVKPVRQKWFGVACCPPNIARTLASLGQYIYAVGEAEVYINLFVSNQMRVNLNGQELDISIETVFPLENSYTVNCRNVPGMGLKLALRIPDYAADYQILIDDNNTDFTIEKGYAVVRLKRDTKLKVKFHAPAKFVRANPKVRADSGKVAIIRGPIVYCLEETDNGSNLSAVYASADHPLLEKKSDAFGGIVEIEFTGWRIEENNWNTAELYGDYAVELKPVPLKAVPYACWNNRGIGEMTVWMKEKI